MKDWKTIKLGTLLTESKIESINPDTKRRIRVKLNVGGIEQRPDTNDKEGATKYYIRKAGQFIYGKQNLHKGAFGIIPIDLDGYESSSDIPSFDVHESCYPEWIFYFFRQGNFYLKLESMAKGVGSKRINPKQLFELNISLPPKEEQRKILDSVSIFEKNQSKLNAELEFQIASINKLKKVTLLEASQGLLTKEWRAANSKGETGSELLKRITSLKSNKKEKNSPVVKKEEIPFELPDTWIWCRSKDINEFGTSVSYGVLIPGDHTPSGIPLIRVGDLEGAEKGTMPSKYVKKEIAAKYKRTELKGGEILLVVVGSTIGKLAIAHNNWKGANIARAVARMEVNKIVSRDYVFNILKSPFMQEYFLKTTRSVGQPTLNINAIDKAPFPLPSLAEQNVICEKLDAVFTKCGLLEQQIEQNKEKVELLKNRFLSEIFGNRNNDKILNQEDSIKENPLVFQQTLMNTLSNYEKNIMLMELEQLLKENGKMSAISLWKMSKFENDIDAFYEELKRLVEVKKTVKESKEKGFLELVK